MPGHVTVSDRAIAQIARSAALEVYGVVGIGARAATPGPAVAGLLRRPSTAGVAVGRLESGALRLDVHVILGRGLNLAAIAESLRARIAYRLEVLAGERLAEVVVHIGRVVEATGHRRGRSQSAAAATVLFSKRVARSLASHPEARGRSYPGRRSKRVS